MDKTSTDSLLKAYYIGASLADQQHLEKTAFIQPLMKGVKFLFTGGHLGKPGSLLSKISPHHIGMPLGFGAFGAATAEEGDAASAFGRGVLGGLVFNAAMPLGGKLGGKLLAPGLKGTGAGSRASGLMRRLGFGGDAVKQMQASRFINKNLHSNTGLFTNTQRALSAGNYKAKNIGKTLGKLNAKSLGLGDDAAKELARLKGVFGNTRIAATEQAKALSDLQNFSKSLYQTGYATGTTGAKAALKATRFAKGVGMAGGGMGLGMALSHPIESGLNTKQPSYFNTYGGH